MLPGADHEREGPAGRPRPVALRSPPGLPTGTTPPGTPKGRAGPRPSLGRGGRLRGVVGGPPQVGASGGAGPGALREGAAVGGRAGVALAWRFGLRRPALGPTHLAWTAYSGPLAHMAILLRHQPSH